MRQTLNDNYHSNNAYLSDNLKQNRNLWLLICIAAFFISLSIFWWNAAPSVSFHDSGEFALAAASGGIPHPPGAPTWSILATTFVKLGGFRDPARGSNLFGGLMGALTIAFMCWLVMIWTLRLFSQCPKWLPIISAATSMLVLLGSSAFLEQSMLNKNFTLMTALLSAALIVATYISFRTEETTYRPPVGLCALLGWICGLAIGNHPTQIVLLLFLACATWAGTRRKNRLADFVRLSGASIIGLCIGLLVFLWLPIRSHSNPIIDCGNIKTWDRFLWAIERKQWPKRSLSAAPIGFTTEWLKSYAFIAQIGIAGIVLALVGLTVIIRRKKVWFLYLAAAIVPYACGMIYGHLTQQTMDISYIHSYGVRDWHLPIYMGLAIASAIGMSFIAYRLRSIGMKRASLLLPLAVLIVISVFTSQAICRTSLRHWNAPRIFLNSISALLPEDCVFLPWQDNTFGIYLYDQYINHPNSRRYSILCSHAFVPKAPVGGVNPSDYWNREKIVRFLTVMNMDPYSQPFRIKPISINRAKHCRLFIDYSPKYPAEAAYLIPAGLMFEVKDRPTTNKEVMEAEFAWRKHHPELLRHPGKNPNRLECDAWNILHRERGAFFADRGLWTAAVDSYVRAVEWMPSDAQVWACLANAQDHCRKTDEAIASYKRALDIDPYLVDAWQNLGIIAAQTGHLREAEMFFVEAQKLDPTSKIIKYNLRLVRHNIEQSDS